MMNDEYFEQETPETEPFGSHHPASKPDVIPEFNDHNDHLIDDIDDEIVDDTPQFGLIDVIEAFTAMRQEYRGQTKETRQFVDTIGAAIEQIESLESQRRSELSMLAEATGAANKSEDTSRRLVDTIVQIDLALGRAVEATVAAERELASADSPLRQPFATLRQRIDTLFQSQGFLCRWFSKTFLEKVLLAIDEQAAGLPPVTTDATIEGFRIIANRLHSLLAEHQIKRIDTAGMLFDGETMNAIQAVASDRPSGTVVSQISPAYFWRGKLIRYADVTVAK